MVENRTRERLTGAAILVAVIVLLVPELLSGPRRAAPQTLAAVDEAPIRTYTLPLGDAQPSTAAATDGARADWPPANSPARAVDGNARTAEGTAPAADGTARTTPPAPAADAPKAAAPTPIASTPPAPKTAAPKPASARTAESRSAEAPARPASAKSASPPTGGVAPVHAPVRKSEGGAAGEWAVQVGSFGSRENADRLARSLKLKGYGASVSESSSRGRKWYRVRVGPERDRTAADAVVSRLRAAGLRGAVAQPR